VTIDDLNKRFAVVSVGNKVVVMETMPGGSIKELWPFEEFKKLLIKERVRVGQRVQSLADVWLHHKDGRRYDRLVYAMPGSVAECGPQDYNGWLGFTVRPTPGDWSKNKGHLLDIICNGNARYFDWVLNWCAALVQQPGRHAMTAIVLRGGQGSGKGHFANNMLGRLFHKQQYLHIIGANQLTGRFNEHLSGKSFVFADESTWGGDPRAADLLKGMVTEDTVNIERKFLPLVEEPSALHIIIASNNDWPIAIPKDDRRYQVLDVADTQRQKDEYFTPLRDELRDGGQAAMLHDLLGQTLNEMWLRHPLTTEGKRDITIRSLSAIERWWFEKLRSGRLATAPSSNGLGEWPAEIPKMTLHLDYIQFLELHQPTERTRRATETELGTFLRKHAPTIGSHRTMLKGTQHRMWSIPSLIECRVEWLRIFEWPDDYTWGDEEPEDPK